MKFINWFRKLIYKPQKFSMVNWLFFYNFLFRLFLNFLVSRSFDLFWEKIACSYFYVCFTIAPYGQKLSVLKKWSPTNGKLYESQRSPLNVL